MKSTATDEPRTAPYSLEAERAVLGGILLENAALRPVREAGLVPADFYRDAHAIVFDAMICLTGAGSPVDSVTLREHLAAEGRLERVGGDEYLLGLIDKIPTLSNICAHAGIVLEKSTRRRLAAMLMEGARRAGHGPLDDAHECAREALGIRLDDHEVILSLRDCGQLALSPRTKQYGPAVRLGYPLIDSAYRSMPRSSMMVIGGRTGAGKSTLMLGGALQLAHEGARPGIVSVEDPEELWGARALAQLVPTLSSERLLSDQYDFDRHADAERGLQLLDRAGVAMSFKLNQPLAQVLRGVNALCKRGCNVIFVDYLQAIRLGLGAKRAELVSDAAQQLKGLCQQHGAVLVLGSQLRRADAAKPYAEPHASDLKETGDIENMAEVILLLWKTSDEDSAEMLGKVAKVKWSPRRPRFHLVLAQNGALERIEGYQPPVAASGTWGGRST
jgi:replicative DNA helicase